MAFFGTLIGTGSLARATSSTTIVASGLSIPVNIGDLLFVAFAERTNNTVTGITDSMGNSYTATNIGTDAGTITGRAFYSRATSTSVLTAITAAAVSSADAFAMVLAAFAGAVDITPVDQNPANITNDTISPFACPATGTLNATNGIAIGWGMAGYGTSWSATAGSTLAVQVASGTTVKAAINYQVYSNTSSLTPQFTAAGNPVQIVLGTTAFKISTDVLMGQALF